MSQPTKPAPLGRGLSALFGDADTSYQTKSMVIAPPPEKRGVMQIPVHAVRPGHFQPRHKFDNEAMAELTESVKVRGILQPLLVRPIKNAEGMYELIAGERRWRAAQLANLHEVPVVIREMTDSEALEYGIIENIQREDLTPLEEAQGYQRLIDEFQHTQDSLSKSLGKSRAYIANLVRLLALPIEIRRLIDTGQLTAGHARVLITADNPLALAIQIVRDGLNVRQAEALAKNNTANRQVHVKKNNAPDADILALEKDLTRSTGFKVKIQTRGKEGSLTLHYQSLEQLDAMIAKLKA